MSSTFVLSAKEYEGEKKYKLYIIIQIKIMLLKIIIDFFIIDFFMLLLFLIQHIFITKYINKKSLNYEEIRVLIKKQYNFK